MHTILHTGDRIPATHTSLYSDCLWWESNFLASTLPVTAQPCMRMRLRNGYTRGYAQIMQHTHTHKAVTGRVEAKKLLSRRRQSNYSHLIINFHKKERSSERDSYILPFDHNLLNPPCHTVKPLCKVLHNPCETYEPTNSCVKSYTTLVM